MHDTLIQGPRESFRGTPDTGDDMNRGERAGLWGNQGDPEEHGRDRGPMVNQGRYQIISPGMNQGGGSEILRIY